MKIKFDNTCKALKPLLDDYSPLIISDNTGKGNSRDNNNKK